MSKTPTQKLKWPARNITIISNCNQLPMQIKNIVKLYGWDIISITSEVNEAIKSISSGKSQMLIVDDSTEKPSTYIIRHFLTDPILTATPILSFLTAAHQSNSAALSRLTPTKIISRPLIPTEFTEGFNKLVALWETQSFTALRMATNLHIQGKPREAVIALNKLKGIQHISSLAHRSLALSHLKNDHPSVAEKILLTTLKKNPRDLGSMLLLGSIYMNFAMPYLAKKIFSSAFNLFGESIAILPDLIQSLIQMGEIEEAIGLLMFMHKESALPEETKKILASLLMAKGKKLAVKTLYEQDRIFLNRISKEWNLEQDAKKEQAKAS